MERNSQESGILTKFMEQENYNVQMETPMTVRGNPVNVAEMESINGLMAQFTKEVG
jgi:hypothetical protein